MKVAILGSTGLVGNLLLNELIKNEKITEVINLTRKDSPTLNPKLKNHKIDFDNLDSYKNLFENLDVVVSCLGTTIKTAGSKEAFLKVDYDYVINSAKIAYEKGVKKYLVISAMGVDENSFIFYNHVKGKMENSLKKFGFSSLQIYRPSLLVGERKEFRIGEEIGNIFGNIFGFVFSGPIKKYKPIQAEDVAKAMLNGILNRNENFVTIESVEMNQN
jgi:uncharacterized protein YbjT (DUF2867 family)